jgi:membrane protein YdbS with pleckstrin-like domain
VDEPFGEGPSALRPSPKLWTARQVLLAAVAGPVVIGATVLAAVAGSAETAAIVAACLLAGTACCWFLLRGRFRSWAYTEREDDLLVSRGYLVRRLSVVPYGRMQMLDVAAGPIERSFGLATVKLHTASATTDAKIPGLPAAEAQRLRDKLAALGQARGAGL